MTDTDYDRDYFDPTSSATPPNGEVPAGERETSHVILDAPNFASFVKITRTTRSREYEKKVNSVLKSVFFASLNNRRIDDAATILDRGPAFALAAGNLADHDERVARVLDMLTAPDNPYVVAAITAIGLVGQLTRNHEDELHNIPDAVRAGRRERRARKAAEKAGATANGHRVQMRLPFGRTVSFAVRLRFRSLRNIGKIFRLQTQEPSAVVNRVFSDQKLLAALEKQGIVIRVNGENPPV